MDETEQLLKDLTEADGIPGYEGGVRLIMERALADVAEVTHDKLGSVIGRHAGAAERPRVMLVGHMDEIGFMVSHITPEGMIRFIAVGWWWDQVLLGHRVTIKTRNRDVLGVFGAKPPISSNRTNSGSWSKGKTCTSTSALAPRRKFGPWASESAIQSPRSAHSP